MKTTFTTGQVAKICSVATRTVTKWIDSGRMKGHRLPGSQDRRIPRESLIEFLDEHNIKYDPIAVGLDTSTRVLVLFSTGQLYDQLVETTKDDGVQFEYAITPFSAGSKMVSFNPHVIVMDVGMGEWKQVVRADDRTYILFANEDTTEDEMIALMRDVTEYVFKKPVDMSHVAQLIGEIRAKDLKSRKVYK